MFEWLRHWRYGDQYGYVTFFRQQDKRTVGKPGIILADLGMPEAYDPEFYTKFMGHVFAYSLPLILHKLILADRGIALIDPSNPLAREPLSPSQLIDMNGSFVNKAGIPYINCKVKWCPPGMKRNPSDHGYFLYTADGKGGAPEVCQKTAAKVAGWYYGHLIPEKKVAWEQQCRCIYDETVAALRSEFPGQNFAMHVIHTRNQYGRRWKSCCQKDARLLFINVSVIRFTLTSRTMLMPCRWFTV